ncbi:MAG: 30S ribosomal protein S17 [Candidatus Omnitrophota bacterium]|nr:30S ribosomal protein S17 [Candidatus Omnitrophota bacterium]
MKGKRSNRKSIIGTVVSDKMNKTVTVRWETRKIHPLYKKFVKKRKKIKAHDEKNEASVGDLVKIMECRPISRSKPWKIVEILEKAQRG